MKSLTIAILILSCTSVWADTAMDRMIHIRGLARCTAQTSMVAITENVADEGKRVANKLMDLVLAPELKNLNMTDDEKQKFMDVTKHYAEEMLMTRASSKIRLASAESCGRFIDCIGAVKGKPRAFIYCPME